ncbi:unnamed protein product, partial [Amoebophrya sp. A25]
LWFTRHQSARHATGTGAHISRPPQRGSRVAVVGMPLSFAEIEKHQTSERRNACRCCDSEPRATEAWTA